MEYHKVLNRYDVTLRDASAYGTVSGKEYMTDATVIVKNFDRLTEAYCNSKKIQKPMTNDALLYDYSRIDIENVNFLFIEFKSGTINRSACKDIHKKLLESNDILELLAKEVDKEYLRAHVAYILVYDLAKQTCYDTRNTLSKDEILYSSSLTYISERLFELSRGKVFKLFSAGFDLSQYEGSVLHTVITMEKDRFNRYANVLSADYVINE